MCMSYISVSETARLLISLYSLIICRLASGHLTPILSDSNGFIGSGRGRRGGDDKDNKNTEALQRVQAMQ